MLLVVVLGFLLIRQCGKETGSTESVKTVIKSDTVIVKGKPDSIPFPKVEYKIKYLKPEKEFITLYDTLYLDSVNVFTTNYNDSLLEGSILTICTGEVLSTDFTYIPKYPKYIIQTDTFRINNETTITRNPYRFYVGSTIGGNANAFSLTPSVMLKTPKKLAFTVGYDLINKTYNLGAFTEISFKK